MNHVSFDRALHSFRLAYLCHARFDALLRCHPTCGAKTTHTLDRFSRGRFLHSNQGDFLTSTDAPQESLLDTSPSFGPWAPGPFLLPYQERPGVFPHHTRTEENQAGEKSESEGSSTCVQ